MSYLSASEVVIHYEEALYQVYAPLPFFTFVSCLITVTLHIVDVRLTCLINITYLLTFTFSYGGP